MSITDSKPNIQLAQSRTTTKHTYMVRGFEPIQMRYGKQTFIPDTVTVTFVDGEWVRTVIEGFRALKDGSQGQERKYRDYGSRDGKEVPTWAQPMSNPYHHTW